MRNLLLAVLLAATVFACKESEFTSVEEYNQYIQDPENDLIKRAEINGYQLVVSYRPTDLLVEQEIGSANVKQSRVDSVRERYNNYYYFILSLSRENREALNPADGLSQYSDLVQTLSFRMNDYVSMTTSAADTIPVGDFMLNRTYGISPSTDVLFVFAKSKAEGQEWVQFNLNEFGMGTGNQRFRFKVSDLENAPHLRFSVIEN